MVRVMFLATETLFSSEDIKEGKSFQQIGGFLSVNNDAGRLIKIYSPDNWRSAEVITEVQEEK